MTRKEADEMTLSRVITYMRDRVEERKRFHHIDPVETEAWIELLALVTSSRQLMNACRMVETSLRLHGSVSQYAIGLCERAITDFNDVHEAEKDR